MAAVRVGKTAKFLQKMGHDVRVLSAKEQSFPETLQVEIGESSIVRTRWWNVNKPVQWFVGGKDVVASQGISEGKAGKVAVLRWLGKLYKHLFNLPDAQIGWLFPALSAGKAMCENWQPDIIYASAPSFTSLLVSRRLAKISGCPWVAEFRDLWVDNPYNDFPVWRQKLERIWERRVLASASGLVTVSQPLADTLKQYFNLPVIVITNGFDPDDYPSDVSRSTDGLLHINYTGMIYPGRRDPGPLFEALRILGSDRIRVNFYGRYLESAREMARSIGVGHLVQIHPPVPYVQSLRLQCEADLLLLLLWNSSQEKGVFTGKVFEYLGSGRPILVVGGSDNVAAELISEKDAGMVTSEPQLIAQYLARCLALKDAQGDISQSEVDVGEFSREEQTRRLASFLQTLTGK
ncbi:glycosyltransferase [Mariprofundus erugo]|nr:glycosyltransferase [Mariprofundus erugo]